MNKLGGFLFLFLLFMNAFGVVFQAVLKPESFEISSIWIYFHEIIDVSYWPIYGELSILQDINNRTCITNKDQSCIDHVSYLFIYYLLAFYMIIGHVLLLNLIIAIFRFKIYFAKNLVSKNSFK
jgi:hypothetical protein